MKSLYYAVTILVCSVAGATAQTLEETFDQLGDKLQAAQQSLVPTTSTALSAAPALGARLQLSEDAPVYSNPDPGAVTPMKLDAKTPVVFQGVEKGFVKVTTPGSPQIYWLAPTALKTSVSGYVGDQLKNAMETMKGIARDLQQNPYVRVKGFSVDVSFTPSFKIDFEMREVAAGPAPAGTISPGR